MIKIITDSVATLPEEMTAGADIEVVTLYVNHEGTEHADVDIDLDDFYSRIYGMVDNLPTSSQPSQHAFEEAFERCAKNGDEVLGIFISTGLSGTYDGALRAARSVESRNIDFRYRMVDSRSCGFDEGAVVLAAADAVRSGKTLDECAQIAAEAVACTRFLFTPETLTFLAKGGRIGGAAALLGNIVQIAPVLTVVDGCAEQLAKVRTRKKALDRIVRQLADDVEVCGLKRIVVHYIGDKTPAIEWARNVIEPLVGHAVSVVPVSPVIGMHVGPAVGVAYQCDRRLEGKLTCQPSTLVCAS